MYKYPFVAGDRAAPCIAFQRSLWDGHQPLVGIEKFNRNIVRFPLQFLQPSFFELAVLLLSRRLVLHPAPYFQQPLALVPRLIEGVSLYLEAAAQADDIPDLFGRLEACGQLIRLDPDVEPTMFRCATVSQDELARLRSIGNVIRLGKVRSLGPDRIELAGGSIPTDSGQVHVDCSAGGLRTRPGRPVFSGNLITLQQIRACQPVFSAALTGYVEATRNDDASKNQICPANRYPDAATDWIPLTCGAQRAEIIWATDPDVSSWMQRARLNATRGLADHHDDPQLNSALTRLFTNIEPAISNLDKLAQTPATGRQPEKGHADETASR